MTTAAETVRKCYRLIATGNFDAAREYWSVDATWHGEFHPRARLGGDQDRDWYFNWFERWATDYPNYSFINSVVRRGGSCTGVVSPPSRPNSGYYRYNPYPYNYGNPYSYRPYPYYYNPYNGYHYYSR